METKFTQQLKKGVLDMIVLRLISEKNTYGYELLQELEKRGGGFFDLKEGTLYPVLYRLEDGGLIQASWQMSEGRSAPKKYYAITPEGKTAFQEYKNVWTEFNQCVSQLCEEVTL